MSRTRDTPLAPQETYPVGDTAFNIFLSRLDNELPGWEILFAWPADLDDWRSNRDLDRVRTHVGRRLFLLVGKAIAGLI